MIRDQRHRDVGPSSSQTMPSKIILQLLGEEIDCNVINTSTLMHSYYYDNNYMYVRICFSFLCRENLVTLQ